ncbi:MAG: hypothetical protein ACI8ZM_000302 [Crocinitomix sp.]|jgi:hypothetical protein
MYICQSYGQDQLPQNVNARPFNNWEYPVAKSNRNQTRLNTHNQFTQQNDPNLALAWAD